MFKPFSLSVLILGISLPLFLSASKDPMTPMEISLSSIADNKQIRKAPPTVKAVKGAFSAFTGKTNAEKVRLRLQPDLESHIVQELSKNEYISVIAQEGDFYCIEPSEAVKAYIFRSFVLDGIVEGNRVNVRLAPDLEAPVIGHVNSGDRVEGKISSINRKWLEIAPPPSTCFYVAKTLVEYAGGPEFKEKMAKRKATVEQLLETANQLSKEELAHSFEEIDFERVKEGFLTIIHEYTDFPKKSELAKEALARVQEEYLQKRIAYLEEKAAFATAPTRSHISTQTASISSVRMWNTIEEALFTTWSKTHDSQSIDSFYEQQKLAAKSITGRLESFKSHVNNKPGDYVIKRKNLPVAYVYSTQVNLGEYVGQEVTLIGSPRTNNNFAFPAYFIHAVE